MKTRSTLSVLTLLALFGLVPPAFAAGLLDSYVQFKGGVYSPSATFNLSNVNVETTFDGETQTGFSGEIAVGHYFLPTLALELGVGYFKGKGSIATTPVRPVDFNVVPIILSARALIPAGPVNPYGELGVGAYFTSFNVTDNLNSFSGNTTFGLHAGAGVNVNLSPRAYLGLSERYVWANPNFGNQKIRLNDTEYAMNGFKLNGFTTSLALGLTF